jgi:hypothetical protein
MGPASRVDLDAARSMRRGHRMNTSTLHEGSNAFMRRALYFARREADDAPINVPIVGDQLAYYLLYRAGASVDMIAACVKADRADISRRIQLCMSLMALRAFHARVERLVAEMGSINFEPREGEIKPFPGPPKLAPRRTVEAAL